MTITALSDPTQMPSPDDDQQTFDNKMAGVFRNLPLRAQQENELTANLNSIAAGGAYALTFRWGASVNNANGFPAGGALSPSVGDLNVGPPMSGTTLLAADTKDLSGTDITALLNSTVSGNGSTLKGHIRLVKVGDPSKWARFAVRDFALANAYYGSFYVNFIDASASTPFAPNDSVMLFFQRTGDKGQQGDVGAPGSLSLLASYTVSTAVAQIDFLTLFSDTYNKYVVEVEGIYPNTSAAVTLCVRLAAGGAVDAGSTYSNFSADAAVMTGSQTQLALPSQLSNLANGEGTFSMEIRNARSTSRSKSIGVQGRLQNTAVIQEGGWTNLAAASGFRLYFSGLNIGGGSVRVYGVKA